MTTQISQQEIQQTAVRLGIPDHPFVARRIARAYNLVETNKVNEISHDDGFYRVHSQYDDKIYTVELNHGHSHCTCPDNERTIFCKHSIASMMVARKQERKAPVLTVKETAHTEFVKASWVVTDGTLYTNVWQDLNGKICCVCGAYYKRDCIHKQAIRDYYDDGNGSAEGFARDNTAMHIENDCGTSEAKELQDKLNGNNGTGDTQSPVRTLDTSDPFQECEMLDIDQIEGRSNGDLVHVLSNGEYVISYRGIMTLAEQHKITFEAARHDETRTVIAYGHRGGNSRASGKPINGSEMTALELAKRNTARQLLPLVEIKALEKKAQLEAEFSWEKAKSKCLKIVPDFKLDILIHDLVKAGTLRQAHPSDYNRKEWLVIFDACKRDAETNGNDDDDGDSEGERRKAEGGSRNRKGEVLPMESHGSPKATPVCSTDFPLPTSSAPSSDDEQPIAVCCICGRTLTNKLSISRCVGPECFKKVGAQGAQFLRDDDAAHRRSLSASPCDRTDELIKASKLYQDEALQKRIVKSCLTLDAPLPVKVLRWLGNEYFGYKNRPILYYVCADGQLNRIDTHNRKLRHVIVTKETAETELDAHALAQMATDVAEDDTQSFTPREELPATMDDFIAKCKQAEAEVEDITVDDDTPTNGDGKRKLQIDKKRNIVLIEPDGTKKPMTFKEVSLTFGGDVI